MGKILWYLFPNLEKTQLKLISRFHDRFAHNVSQETNTTQYIRKLQDKYVEKPRNLRMIPSSSNDYQALKSRSILCVDFEKNTIFMQGMNDDWNSMQVCSSLYA